MAWRNRKTIGRSLLGLLLALIVTAPTPADEILLKNGRSWTGDIVRENDDVIVIRTVGGTVTVARDTIRTIVRGDEDLAQFHRFKSRLDLTDTEAQYELGLWARENGLAKEAEFQFELVLAQQPDHEGAHRGLGHVRHDGRWMTRNEANRAKGLVKFEGRWMALDERARIQRRRRREADAEKWAGTVRRLRRDLDRGSIRRKAQAAQRLREIDDPLAVPHIVRLLEDRDADVRRAAIAALAANGRTEAARTVAEMTVNDDDATVRVAAAAALRDLRSEKAMWGLVSALEKGSKGTRVRAAQALAIMRPRESVPALIEALFRRVRPERKNGFDSGLFDNWGPRIVSGDPGARRDDDDDYEAKFTVNEQALEALKTITGQDFDYDKTRWLTWWTANGHTLPEWPKQEE